MTSISNADDGLGSKKLCCDCIGDEYLSILVKTKGDHGKCDYCLSTAAIYDLNDIADLIEEAFDAHYVRTATEPNSMEYRLSILI